MPRRPPRFACLCALILAGNAGFAFAKTPQKFTLDQEHLSHVKNRPGEVSAPPVRAVAVEAPSSLQLALDVNDANEDLLSSIDALSLSSVPADVRDFIVDESIGLRDHSFDLISFAVGAHNLRLYFEKTGNVEETAQEINESAAGIRENIQEEREAAREDGVEQLDEVTAFLAKVRQKEGDSFKPDSEILLADLALGVSFNNIAFIKCQVMAQELYPLALKVNAAAAKTGAKGIDAKTVSFLRSLGDMSSKREEWARFDKNFQNRLNDAPKNFKAKADEILSHAIYNQQGTK